MKRLLLAVMMSAVFVGCTTTPVSPGVTSTTPASLNDQIGVAVLELTAAAKATNELLSAGKITVKQHKDAFEAFDVIRTTLAAAQDKALSDPAQASALLAFALNQLAATQGATK